MSKVMIWETNSDLIYAQLNGEPIWFFGPVTPDMYGKFREDATAWAAGEWEPNEGDGQHEIESAEGLTAVAVLDTSTMEVFYPGGPDQLGAAARLWLLGKDMNGA